MQQGAFLRACADTGHWQRCTACCCAADPPTPTDQPERTCRQGSALSASSSGAHACQPAPVAACPPAQPQPHRQHTRILHGAVADSSQPPRAVTVAPRARHPPLASNPCVVCRCQLPCMPHAGPLFHCRCPWRAVAPCCSCGGPKQDCACQYCRLGQPCGDPGDQGGSSMVVPNVCLWTAVAVEAS